MDKNFTAVRNGGIQMNINGFRISIQFGPGNYVSDPSIRFNGKWDASLHAENGIWQSDDAEVMIWGRDDQPLFKLDDGIIDDQVMGWCTSDCVARMIGCLASCGDEDPRRAIAQIWKAQ
jgi:hypothetical protein